MTVEIWDENGTISARVKLFDTAANNRYSAELVGYGATEAEARLELKKAIFGLQGHLREDLR